MPKISLTQDKIPKKVSQAIEILGAHIQLARKRRGLTRKKLAERVGVTEVTMGSIEHGRPTASVASYFTALWALGMTEEIENICKPKDLIGETLQNKALPMRVRASKKMKGNDDHF